MATKRRRWVNMDNNIGGHRRVVDMDDDVTLAALGLHLLGICYCDQQQTDGVIPSRAVRRFAFGDYDPALAALLSSGMWEDGGDHYTIHDYLDWQMSAEEQAAASERARVAAAASWESRRKAASNATGIASGKADLQYLDQTRPDERERARDDKTKSLPPCLSKADVSIVGQKPVRADKYVWSALEAAFGIMSEVDRAGLAGAIRDGCLTPCDGSKAVTCALHLVYKVEKHGPRKPLLCKCFREDRGEVDRG